MPNSPAISELPQQRLIGVLLEMSFSKDRTQELWQTFMPKKRLIRHPINSDLVSLQIYPESFASVGFDPQVSFIKWAAVKVAEDVEVPDGMQELVIPKGIYAIFDHIGPASEFSKTIDLIFNQWLPESGFVLDSRPHYEVLPEGYNPMSAEAKEQVYIPIKAA